MIHRIETLGGGYIEFSNEAAAEVDGTRYSAFERRSMTVVVTHPRFEKPFVIVLPDGALDHSPEEWVPSIMFACGALSEEGKTHGVVGSA